MTKKSLSRQQRDQQARELANLNCWDDLNVTASSIHTGMEVSNSMLLLALSDRSLFKYMPKKADCIAAIQTLSKDLEVLTKELKDIGALHQGRTGTHTDFQDLHDSLRTGEMYHAFQARYQAIVMPNVQIISQQIAAGTNARNAQPIIDASVLPAATDAQPAQASEAPTTWTSPTGMQYNATPAGRGEGIPGVYALDESAHQPASTPQQGAAPSAV